MESSWRGLDLVSNNMGKGHFNHMIGAAGPLGSPVYERGPKTMHGDFLLPTRPDTAAIAMLLRPRLRAPIKTWGLPTSRGRPSSNLKPVLRGAYNMLWPKN
jgi:hypothetical protein